MPPKEFKFTNSDIQALPPAPEKKRLDYDDPKTPGLSLRVTDSGTKTFSFRLRAKGSKNPTRITIGKFPAVNVDQARREAAKIRVQFIEGANPSTIKRAAKGEPTFEELFERYLKDKQRSENTVISYRTTVGKHLKSILPLKISELTRDRLRALKVKSDAQSNRVRAIISGVFNWANAEGLIDHDNPAKVIKHRKIKSRDRFLQVHEVESFLAALDGNRLADLFLLCLFTGARRGNVQQMAWADLDLVNGLWRKPTTKNGEPHIVPLLPEAVSIIEARDGLHPKYVFPGLRNRKTGKVSHLKNPQRSWEKLRKDSGIEDLDIHDLRRTLGSWQTIDGTSLTIVGKTLGHKSLVATQVYARLNLEPVRESMERALKNLKR